MAQPTLGTPISANASGGVTTLTIPNVVIASGESLFVSAGAGQAPSRAFTTAVRNGRALTQAWPSVHDTNFCLCKGWFDSTPDVGTFNVVVTLDGSTEHVGGVAVPLTDASAATGGITNSVNPSATPSVGTLEPTANDIVLAAIHTDSGNVGSLAVTGSGVEVAEIENIAADTSHGLQKITTGGTVTASWSTGNDSAAMGAVIVQGTGGGGATNEPRKPSGAEILRPFNMFRGRR